MELVRVSGEFELPEFEISGFYSTNKGKTKPVKLIVQTSFAEKKNVTEGSVTFQNFFSSFSEFVM